MLNAQRLREESSSGVVPAPSWQGKRVGRFKLISLLGQGAMGRVFLVEDTLLQRYAALKVLPKQLKRGSKTIAVERLFHEARAAATLDHPNVVTVYEVNESGGVYYIAMELVEGGSLKDLVKAAGPMEYPRACMLCADAGEALGQAHALGIVHRDVKPANLMMTRSGRCKITDFGLARIEEATDLSGLSESCGTPQFIAPELLRGTRASAASDVYSLGATLWYLLTGRPPFLADTAGELLHKHLEEPLPDLADLRPDLPAALVRAIETALEKQPSRRFASADQFAKVLRVHTIPVESSSPSLAEVAEPPQVPDPGAKTSWRPKRRDMLIASGCAAVVLAAVGLFAMFGRGSGNQGDGSRSGNGAPAAAPGAGRGDAAAGNATAPPDGAPGLVSSKLRAPAPQPTARRTIDLLAHLDLQSAIVKGDWHFEGADLVSDSSGPAIIELPQAVPEEYDFRIEFTPQDCAEQLLYKPNVHLGGGGVAFNWGMNVGELCGFESIDGKHMFDQGVPGVTRRKLRTGARHMSMVRVRKDGVQGWIDDELVIDWKTDFNDLGRVQDWSMRSNDKLGLGSWNKPTRFHKAELIDRTTR